LTHPEQIERLGYYNGWEEKPIFLFGKEKLLEDGLKAGIH